METPGDPDGYALAFAEGKSAIEEQATALKEMRDRTATITSVAAVIAGLGATLALADERADRLTSLGVAGTVLAAVAFGGIVVCAARVWHPFKGVFARDAGTIVGSYVEGRPPAPLPEIHRELALWLGHHAQYNREHLGRRLMWFGVSLWAFVVEVGGLMLMILDVAQ